MKKKPRIQLKEKQEITDSVLLDDFLSLDSETGASGSLTEWDILNNAKNKNNTATDCNEDEDEDNDNAEINKPSYDENTPEAIFWALERSASVKLTYLASMVDRLTDFCLKVCDEIGVSSIKVMNPPIDTRSSLFVAKSESE
ncbi:hypothetical protein TNCV_3753671 [Trichonephila clavipes]|nr:hypothetical protein TNCV_3753671 [Trichonephila clavipes]